MKSKNVLEKKRLLWPYHLLGMEQIHPTQIFIIVLAIGLTIIFPFINRSPRFVSLLMVFIGLSPIIARFKAARMLCLYILAFFVWVPRSVLPSFLIAILPGAPIIEIAFYGIFIFWLFYTLIANNKTHLKSSYLWLFVALLLCGFIALLNGPLTDRTFAWQMLRWACLLPAIGYILMTNLFNKPEDMSSMAFALILGGLAFGIVVLLGYLGSLPVIDYFGSNQGEARILGDYSLPLVGVIPVGQNTTAVYFSMLSVFAFSLLLSVKHGLQQTIGIFALTISLAAVVLSGTRTAWVGTGAGLLLVMILFVYQKHRISWGALLSLASSIVLIILILGLSGIAKNSIIADRLTSLTSPKTLMVDPNAVLRLQAWQESWQILSHYPLGIGFIRYFSTINMGDRTPHSQFLNIALGTGFIGVGLYIMFLVSILWRLIRRLKVYEGNYLWIIVGAIGGIIAYLINAIGVDTTRRFGVDLTLFLICGLGIAAMEAGARLSKNNSL